MLPCFKKRCFHILTPILHWYWPLSYMYVYLCIQCSMMMYTAGNATPVDGKPREIGTDTSKFKYVSSSGTKKIMYLAKYHSASPFSIGSFPLSYMYTMYIAPNWKAALNLHMHSAGTHCHDIKQGIIIQAFCSASLGAGLVLEHTPAICEQSSCKRSQSRSKERAIFCMQRTRFQPLSTKLWSVQTAELCIVQTPDERLVRSHRNTTCISRLAKHTTNESVNWKLNSIQDAAENSFFLELGHETEHSYM